MPSVWKKLGDRNGNGVGVGCGGNGRSLVSLKRTHDRPRLQCMLCFLRRHCHTEGEQALLMQRRLPKQRLLHWHVEDDAIKVTASQARGRRANRNVCAESTRRILGSNLCYKCVLLVSMHRASRLKAYTNFNHGMLTD
jgi:hypothetical protein